MAEQTRYVDALTVLKQADGQALRAMEAAKADPADALNAALPGFVGAAISLLAAQAHATLAVADALDQLDSTVRDLHETLRQRGAS